MYCGSEAIHSLLAMLSHCQVRSVAIYRIIIEQRSLSDNTNFVAVACVATVEGGKDKVHNLIHVHNNYVLLIPCNLRLLYWPGSGV